MVGGEFYIPNTNFYASANLGREYVKVKGLKQQGATDYAAEIGLLPITNLLVAVGVVGVKDHGKSDNDPTIRAKYLTQAGSNDVNLEASAEFGNAFNSYAISSDYYIDRAMSVGVSYNLITQDHAKDIYNLGINARTFISQNASLQFGVNGGRIDGMDNYGGSFGGTYRF